MIGRLMKWLDASTCNFLAAKTICGELDNAGFCRLDARDSWQIEKGGKYYVVKNDSAVFAFIVGTESPAKTGFRIISSHSDSPCFKIKPNAEIYGEGEWYHSMSKSMAAVFFILGLTAPSRSPGE